MITLRSYDHAVGVATVQYPIITEYLPVDSPDLVLAGVVALLDSRVLGALLMLASRLRLPLCRPEA